MASKVLKTGEQVRALARSEANWLNSNMAEPSRLPGDHELFICGNDPAVKRETLSEWLGWKPGNVVDLGDVTNSRGIEKYLALWVRWWGVVGNPHFNIHIVRGR